MQTSTKWEETKVEAALFAGGEVLKLPAIVSDDGKQLVLTKRGSQRQFTILYRDKDLELELSCIHYAEAEGGRPADRVEVWLSLLSRRAGVHSQRKPFLNDRAQQEVQAVLKVAMPLWSNLKRYLGVQHLSLEFT